MGEGKAPAIAGALPTRYEGTPGAGQTGINSTR